MEALFHIHEPIYLVSNSQIDRWVWGGRAFIGYDKENLNKEALLKQGDGKYLKIKAYIPQLPLENLGDTQFKARHQLKYPYIAGAMANGITSVEMVESMAQNGMIGFFGAGGLSISEVEKAIIYLKNSVKVFGFNFIHSLGDPEFEMALAKLYIKHEVHKISAAAFMRITLSLVYYRVKGIHQNIEGNIVTPNQIVAKVSRVEVARQFFSPPPQKLVAELLNQGLITQSEAELSAHIPMAQDLTAEADSGGHTDNRPAISLWPTMILLKDEFNQKFNYATPLCVGFAGGISTPESVAAAFQMGAGYVLTGSINQSCIEAGTSDSVKQLLAQVEQADVAMAPAADMFEIGARVQVLKRGTLFAVRAEKLYQIYKNYNSFEDVPEKLQKEIEDKYLQAPFYQKWEETKEFFKIRNIKEVERAEVDPHHKMALVFRSYLGLSSRWSIVGETNRAMDYQIWCGPAMGAFNQWVKGSYLEKSENRRVADIALNLLLGASISTRLGWLRAQGVGIYEVGGKNFKPFKPVDRATILKLVSQNRG
ncbi:MAG: PfaD family polyunsaturated fatty acid/polyketide biosynthesis protein [Desulfamplus sp.]|nr:PfaD family polyunsaturated fatty acid/polyketide biosynthesis protein [Desulfamplus sp.]MBF0388489.1 PfaD family polyunsaturated fatty acid/polyketide biosynthesis protein [Desulfamplus sp.]